MQTESTALRQAAAPLGYEVVQAELRDCLHLKTGATFAGPDIHGTPVLLYNERAVDPRQFAGVEPLAVDETEPAAANCLRAGARLILPAGNPRTAGLLRDRGFQVTRSRRLRASEGRSRSHLHEPDRRRPLGQQRLGLVEHLAEAVDDQPVRFGGRHIEPARFEQVVAIVRPAAREAR